MEAGVRPSHIIVDPGIGFAKTLEQNCELLKDIDRYRYSLPIPFLLGVSKKGTVRELMEDTDPEMLGIGTVAMTCWAYQKGIEYIRVHDVKANKLAINVMKNLK
jgi:dihydropteroate synthase